MDKKEERLLDHDYDGIKEIDNDLPPWWLWLFYITIAFAVIYMLYFHVLNIGDSSAVEYQKEMNPNWKAEKVEVSYGSIISEYRSPYYTPKGDISPQQWAAFENYIGPKVGFNILIMEAMRRADTENLEKLKSMYPEYWAELTKSEGEITPAAAVAAQETTPELNYEQLTDAASLEAGKKVFLANCASCHGQLGEGLIGPNMTDDYYIHGGGINDIISTIIDGVPAKGMISWRGILNEDQIHQVGSYLMSLRGTNPPNAKAPQGELVKFP